MQSVIEKGYIYVYILYSVYRARLVRDRTIGRVKISSFPSAELIFRIVSYFSTSRLPRPFLPW